MIKTEYKVGDKVIREYFPSLGYIVDVYGNRKSHKIGVYGFKEAVIIGITEKEGVKEYCLKDKPDLEGLGNLIQYFSEEEMKQKVSKK